MSDNWLANKDTTTIHDVDSAQQFGIIGRQESPITTKLTDQAFQSYLTNAPIPRWYYPTLTGSYTAAYVGALFFTTVGAQDPYGVQINGGPIRIPIDGYYSMSAWIAGQSAAGGGYNQLQLVNTTTTAVYAITLYTAPPTALTAYQGSLSATVPCRAGDVIQVSFSQQTGATLTGISGAFSGSWVAPLQNYKGGQ